MRPVREEFGKRRLSCKNYIKMALEELSRDIADGTHIYQKRDKRRKPVRKVPKFLVSCKSENCYEKCRSY
jgi:hypothetical protein